MGLASAATEAPPELLVAEAPLTGTVKVIDRAAVSRATCAVEVALVPHARPVGCCFSSALITASIFEPAPIRPGG